MALKITTLGSGSKGNCAIVYNEKTKIMIDCGLSTTSIIERLDAVNLSIEQIDAILITHEHIDHIKAIQDMSNTYQIPIYAHEYAFRAINNKFNIVTKNKLDIIERGFSIGDIDINPFRVSHDAVHPLGYSLNDVDTKITYATDMGYASNSFLDNAKGSETVLIESNHDLDMLLMGKYPDFLKRRIVSSRGHLSNYCCAQAIERLFVLGTQNFILGHLSEENNLPELAHHTTVSYMSEHGIALNTDYKLSVATQYEPIIYKGKSNEQEAN